MKYFFLPNINKTKILDNIELSLPQQLYIAQHLDPLNPKYGVVLVWDRRVGLSFAQAILYIETLLHNYFKGNNKNTEIRDHYRNGEECRANEALIHQIAELLKKDNFILGYSCHNRITILRQNKPIKPKHKEYQLD